VVSPDDADIILISLCDITEIRILKEAREQYPNKLIAVGGAISYFYQVLTLFADFVNVGQGFEFFKCQSIDEIKALDCVYSREPKTLIPSTLIDWEKCPISQVSSGTYYYWSSVGCKNKCAFCFTSWTNKYQSNNPSKCKAAKKLIPTNKSLNIISNEQSDEIHQIRSYVKDLMLVDYVNMKTKPNCNVVHAGVEFATEKTRRENGKFFTNDQFVEAIKRAISEKTGLQLFCIGGIDTWQDWRDLFSIIPSHTQLGPIITFKFTNLEYQQFTPLYRKRHEINYENYLTNDFNIEIMENHKYRLGTLMVNPIKYPAHALWRMGMSLSINHSQFDAFWKLRNCKDFKTLQKAIEDNRSFNTDYQNTVKFWYQH
jgi:hypothetical protein